MSGMMESDDDRLGMLEVLARTWADEAQWVKLKLGFDIGRYQVDVFRAEPRGWDWSIERRVGPVVQAGDGREQFAGPLVPAAHGDGGCRSAQEAKVFALAALTRLIQGEPPEAEVIPLATRRT
jgi:hypothetical protein